MAPLEVPEADQRTGSQTIKVTKQFVKHSKVSLHRYGTPRSPHFLDAGGWARNGDLAIYSIAAKGERDIPP